MYKYHFSPVESYRKIDEEWRTSNRRKEEKNSKKGIENFEMIQITFRNKASSDIKRFFKTRLDK
jgi:hypothetical protein